MTPKLPPLPNPADWKRTNPTYEKSPPEWVDGLFWMDGGVWSDVVTAAPGTKKK